MNFSTPEAKEHFLRACGESEDAGGKTAQTFLRCTHKIISCDLVVSVDPDVFADPRVSPRFMGLTWLRNGVPYMWGGLVLHSDGEWSIHT